MYYIGNFRYVSDQQNLDEPDRRHGDFSLIVESSSLPKAVDKFRQRIESFRRSTDFFKGHCAIFISNILEFEQIPRDQAVMLNFRSFAGDPMMPHIECTVPSEQSNACSIHHWHGNRPATEGEPEEIFIVFNQ